MVSDGDVYKFLWDYREELFNLIRGLEKVFRRSGCLSCDLMGK